jgi:glucokinase
MSRQARVVLAGDVGGTHARLALFEVGGVKPTLLTETIFPSAEYDGLEPIVLEFLRKTGGKVDRGCLGVACPVEEGICHAANLGWDIRAEGFGEAVGVAQVRIINDFEAVGHGIPVLGPDDLETLQEGSPQVRGPVALIGAGTGLGQGYLLWEQGGYAVHASEGGHADFAPADPTQWELLLHLRATYGHVSWERVVSGHGLVAAYEFLRDSSYAPEGEEMRRELKNGDPAEVISHHALAGNEPLSIKAMEIFIHAFGAQAGNLALTLRTTGGVYLCGGIAPKILPRLKDGPFFRAFLDKGRLTELMQRIPVRVVVNESVGLWGAAAVAGRL